MLRVQDDDGTERALVDPNALSADRTVTLDWWLPSWDGAHLAYKRLERQNLRRRSERLALP